MPLLSQRQSYNCNTPATSCTMLRALPPLTSILALLLLAAHLAYTSAQMNTMADICKGQNITVFPGSNCDEFVECNFGNATVKRCPRGQKFDFNITNTCIPMDGTEAGKCKQSNGLWRRLMDTGGLIGVHCTLLPNSKNVLIWHRSPDGVPPQPGMASLRYPGREMLSSLIDTANQRYQGYEVGPQFCSGHNPLPDGSILSCGGEPVGCGTCGRVVTPEDAAIDKCKIFSCNSTSDITSCSWRTLGKISISRWYGSMIQFPAYNRSRGDTFAMHMGGSLVAIDSGGYGQAPRKVDWVFTNASSGLSNVSTGETNFIKVAGGYAHYPILQLMPYRQQGKYVMFQWANDYGELVTVDDPDNSTQPINVSRVVPSIRTSILAGKANSSVFTTYPAGGTFAFHALEYPWKKIKITIFGGHMGLFTTAWQLRGYADANRLALNTSYTLDLSENAVNATWQEELMPDNALLRTAVPLPNGKFLLLHGARRGIEASTGGGYGCTKERIKSNWMYNPKAQPDKRWTVDPVPNPTFRGYHSCALLLPDGSVFAGGSDADMAQGLGGGCTGAVKPAWNVDSYVPPTNYNSILKKTRPRIVRAPAVMRYNRRYNITYAGDVDECSLVTPGANTHHTEQSSRVVFLRTVKNYSKLKILTVQTPNDVTMILPMSHMLFCMSKRDVYSRGVWIRLRRD